MNKIKDFSLATSCGKKSEPEEKMNILCLPIEMVDAILSYLSYDELAKLRAVSKYFNSLCSQKLNKGFAALELFHNKCLKAVKSRLPRRESERKNHPLARHSDILMAVETRLSMLNMTFIKYIDAHQCCFIPGKVLDEAFRVLKLVKSHSVTMQGPNLPRPHDFLQEYRDISSMAMEHFDDKILPAIRERMRTDHRLGLYFKPAKPLKPSAATGSAGLQALKVNVHVGRPTMYGCHQVAPGLAQLVPVYTSPMPAHPFPANMESSVSGSSAEAQAQPQPKPAPAPPSPLMVRIVQVLKDLRAKVIDNDRKVARANRNAITINKNLKSKSLGFQRKTNQQMAMIKNLRRELRETRNAMSVMAKDLNRMKQDQSPASGQPSCSNLATCAVFSVSCVPEEGKKPVGVSIIKTRGMKRKLEDKPEVPRKR